MVLGLSALGKVPTAWSGRPLAVIEREVPLQDHFTTAHAFTDDELLNTRVAYSQSTPAVVPLVLVPAVVPVELSPSVQAVAVVAAELPLPPQALKDMTAARATAKG